MPRACIFFTRGLPSLTFRPNHNALVGHLHSCFPTNPEANFGQPIAAQPQKRHLSLSVAPPHVLVPTFVNLIANGQMARLGQRSFPGNHDELLRFVPFRLLFREAAGCLNTVVGPPAVFPFRVLYSCAPPGHRKRETQKNHLADGSGFRLRRCVQHLTQI